MQVVSMLGPRCLDYPTGKEASSSHSSGIHLFHNNYEIMGYLMMPCFS